jgi:hypothetical protein
VIDSGGQDWSSLADSVLCATCYHRYKRSGSLDRSCGDAPLAAANAQECTFLGCNNPKTPFREIEKDCIAGRQDWSSLQVIHPFVWWTLHVEYVVSEYQCSLEQGAVLCFVCYQRFKRSGSIDKMYKRRKNSKD